MMPMRERVNQSTNHAAGFLHKPLHAKTAGILPTVEEEPKAESAISQRRKRVRVAQDHVIRTVEKENGKILLRRRPDNVKDIYTGDANNEVMVVAYVEHIYAYLHQREKTRLSANYMDGMELTPRMRAILVDWMVCVAQKFYLCQETLFLAVDIVDRFLALPEIDVSKDELQMVGVTGLFMAGKFEEVYAAELEDHISVAFGACTKDQVLQTEMMMATALEFDFSRPSAVHFLRRNGKAAEASLAEYYTAKYVAELSLLSIEFVEVVPSLTAAAAMYVSLRMHRRQETTPIWNVDMEYYSGHEESAILFTAEKLLALVKAASKCSRQAIFKKYNSETMYGVASFATTAAETLVLAHCQVE